MSDEALHVEGGLIAQAAPRADGVRCFKGLPYAAPPVGPLRWRAPAPVAPWSGVRPVDAFGPASLQGIVFDDIDPTLTGVSEDCLYLNVWAPKGERLPVLFWIHGGGFAVGSGAEPRYDGGRLAARGIVVVTVNHRLNALGFLAHPELGAEAGASGNYGLLDLIAALQWVSRNIQTFGGDPAQVTIAGESAGSMAVSALMASPLARGLFRGAIGQSGAMFDSPSRRFKSRAQAEAMGEAFARKLGVRTPTQLRALPAEAILAAAPGIGFFPHIDGHVLPRPLAEIFAAGEMNDVPLMAGWNKDEGFNFDASLGREATPLSDIVETTFGPHAGAAQAFYPSATADEARASSRRLGGDMVIEHSTWAWIEAQQAHGASQIFQFRFDRAPMTPQGWFGARASEDAGAFHAGELLYVFDNLDVFPWTIEAADERIAALAASYWVHFVKSGDPNGPGLPTWPSHRDAGAPVFVFDAESRAEPQSESERARHAFLAEVVRAG